MNTPREIVPSSGGSDAATPYDMSRGEALPEMDRDDEGPSPEWQFWDDQIKAGLVHENRWRTEALDSERCYFGPDNDPGAGGDPSEASKTNVISDKTALIHATVDVLKPLIYSETPQPVVRRRFYGDGKPDPVALMAAEAGQRLAAYFVDNANFDLAMECARDDWLIAGRGAARVLYSAEFGQEPAMNPLTGQPLVDPATGDTMMMPVKTKEEVKVAPLEWARVVFAPASSFEKAPWLAIEVPMTRTKVKARFGEEICDSMRFDSLGLKNASRGFGDEDRDSNITTASAAAVSGATAKTPFDTASVWEIWNREDGKVIWWSAAYTDGVLDEKEDPLGLEYFYPMPRPLLATAKGQEMTPRPDIKYYERRALEVDMATKKMKSILNALSVSGLFPGQMKQEVEKLLSGNNVMVPVSDWIGLLEKGGMSGMIQWLPIEAMIKALQALQLLRQQAKEAMFEASGVSDVMRATSDPSETATAQQIKGRYAGLRLSERQRRMAIYARDIIRLMLEIGLEHFDTETIADICAMDLPMTEMEREMMIAQQQAVQAQFEQLAQAHQQIAQLAEQGVWTDPVPPPPEPPELEKIPETSWEAVHDRLRTDYGRKITVTIETQSTVLADEQADKEARIEFLSAFATFVSELAPLAGSGQFDYKTVKELLLFGVRGFPKSRTLESLISSLPDEPKGKPPEDTAVTVAKMKGEIDKMLKEMEMADSEADRQHEMKMKGVDVVARSAEMQAEAASAEPPQPQTESA